MLSTKPVGIVYTSTKLCQSNHAKSDEKTVHHALKRLERHNHRLSNILPAKQHSSIYILEF